MTPLTQNKPQIQFLELLRAGLWNKAADPTLFGEKTDWNIIVKYAKMQAVIPLVYDGIISLPEELRPPIGLMFKLMAYVDKIEKLNNELDLAAGEVSEKLGAAGIKSVLLKGQGNAQFYPNPLRRQCGDIDLYVGRDHYGRSKVLLADWYKAGEHPESVKHSSFEIGELSLELHKVAFELSLKKKSFAMWEREHVGGSSTVVRLGGKPVHIPDPTFNVFYVFAHAFHHFMSSGIGLRQLCDLTVLLTRLRDEIDGDELRRRLRQYRLETDWAFFCRLCVEELGLAPEAAFSDTCMSGKALAQAIKFHDFIFAEGNFGQFDDRPYYHDKPYLIRKTISFWRHNVRYYKRFAISPLQTVVHYFDTLVTGVKSVLKRR